MVKKPVKKAKVKKVLTFKDKVSMKTLTLKAKWNSLVSRIKIFAVKLRGY